VGQHKQVLTQVLLYLLPIFVTNSYSGLLPYFSTDVLHIGSDLYGFLSASAGIGALLVTFFLANYKNFGKLRSLLLIGGMAQGLALIALAFSTSFAAALLVLIFVGGAGTIFMTINNTLIQQQGTDQVRGREMSLREVSFGLGPAGSLISGAVAGGLGIPIALIIAGGITLAVLLGIRTGLPEKKAGTG